MFLSKASVPCHDVDFSLVTPSRSTSIVASEYDANLTLLVAVSQLFVTFDTVGIHVTGALFPFQ